MIRDGGKNTKKPLSKRTGVIFWSIFAAVLIVLLVANRHRIVENFYALGVPIPHWFPRKQVIEPEDQPPQEGVSAEKPEQSAPFENNEDNNKENPLEQPPEFPSLKRKRALYFVSVDQGGNLNLTAAERALPDTDAPLTETISALLSGPSEKEKELGFISLIPESTRIQSVSVQQGTAYINFNEDFLYNTYGREGYSNQVRQVVWTATEFSSVKKVQILIEGRRESYLGDNVWIGDALSRENLP